jgi:hypothetical protein
MVDGQLFWPSFPIQNASWDLVKPDAKSVFACRCGAVLRPKWNLVDDYDRPVGGT